MSGSRHGAAASIEEGFAQRVIVRFVRHNHGRWIWAQVMTDGQWNGDEMVGGAGRKLSLAIGFVTFATFALLSSCGVHTKSWIKTDVEQQLSRARDEARPILEMLEARKVNRDRAPMAVLFALHIKNLTPEDGVFFGSSSALLFVEDGTELYCRTQPHFDDVSPPARLPEAAYKDTRWRKPVTVCVVRRIAAAYPLIDGVIKVPMGTLIVSSKRFISEVIDFGQADLALVVCDEDEESGIRDPSRLLHPLAVVPYDQ